MPNSHNLAKDNTTLTIATYNIELSRKPEQIAQNLYTLAETGTQVFCLQEVLRFTEKEFIIDTILKKLGSNWSAEFFIGEDDVHTGFGVAIIWNKKVLQLKEKVELRLPQLQKHLPHEILFTKLIHFSSTPILRRTLVLTYTWGEQRVRICSMHLDALGGAINRRTQAAYVLNELQKKIGVDYEIICGDFNTIDSTGLQKEKERMQAVFRTYDFQDMTANIPWSQDIYYGNFVHDEVLVKKIIVNTHFHMPKKLDYIWSKHMRVLEAARKDIMGSDHFPVVAKLTPHQ